MSGGGRISTAMEDLFDEQDLQEAIEASLHDQALQPLLDEAFFSCLLQLLQSEEAQIPSKFACSSNLDASSSTALAEVFSPESARRTGKEMVEGIEDSSLVKKLCGICFEEKYPFEIFDNMGCSHSFCSTCIGMHIRSKLEENLASIVCPEPDCSEHLTPEQCLEILPKQTFEDWSLALLKADIPLSQRFYCPFPDCSALLLKDTVPDDEVGSSSEAAALVIKEAECPECRRLFCAQCCVPWHAGLDCSEVQMLSDSEKEKFDLMLFKLAKENEWQRCASCKHIVEKDSGCCHITCRCGYEFCYKCGSEWNKAGLPCDCPD